ncbi:autophagy protein Apg5-domain-containing protein [Flagelloscypha sp. PMI_526]|nr:autophagy protein Apg5-domain-containing protein [Flagelloscypha sp. PMI_526]
MSQYGTTRPAKDRGLVDYHTTLFRRLTWEGTVPLEIRIEASELPADSERGLECYFIQAPLRNFFMDVVFHESSAQAMKPNDWWFSSEDGSPLKWHWPLGVIYDNHLIWSSLRPQPSQVQAPLKLTLHLASPPNEKLLMSPSEEACKSSFMGQLKEADFLRWGNTKRMTGLRKQDQDALWEGIKEHNFEEYWRVASKVTPYTTPTRSQSPVPPQSSTSMVNRPPSTDPAGPSTTDREGAYNVRSVPVRIYLPEGPVLQDLAPPNLEDGSPHTLDNFLTARIPLLFPSLPATSRTKPNPLAYPIIQGILTPLDSEIAWLSATMAGADGWLNVFIGVHKR